jgi:hypothetical protein
VPSAGLLAVDVQALPGAVAERRVAAAADDAGHRLDSEVTVADRPIPSQDRRAAVDVETVIARPPGDVVLQEAVAVLPTDQEPVDEAVFDSIATDDVACAAEEGMVDSESDARSASANDDVVRDQIVVSLLDADAVARETRFPVITIRLPGPRVIPPPFRTRRFCLTRK